MQHEPDYIPKGLPPRPVPDPHTAPEGYFAAFPSRMMERVQGVPPGVGAASPKGLTLWVRFLWAVPGLAMVAMLVSTHWLSVSTGPHLVWPDGPTAERILNADPHGWDEYLLAEALGDTTIQAFANQLPTLEPALFTPAAVDTPPRTGRTPTTPADTALLRLQQGLDELFDQPSERDALMREAWLEIGNDPFS